MLRELPASLLLLFLNSPWPRAPSKNQHVVTLIWHMYLPGDPPVEQTLRIAGPFQGRGPEPAILFLPLLRVFI